MLATAVIASHSGYLGFPFTSWAAFFVEGRQAVCFFYIISGFYMAMVLNTKYQENTKRFYINRFLRLWPTYFLSIILSILFLNNFNGISQLLINCSFWGKAYIWFANFFILGTDSFWFLGLDVASGHFRYFPAFINENSNGYYLLMNTPSFSISIEIIFYLIAPFILKSIKRTWAFLIIGIAYYFSVELSGNMNIIFQYHFFPSSFIFFALGALSWHYFQNQKTSLTNPKNYIALLIVSISLMFTHTLLPGLTLIFIAFGVPVLFNLTKSNSIDRFVGELSYPLYILHFPVITYLTSFNLNPDSFGIIALSVTLLLAIPIHLFFERPIDKLRQKYISKQEIVYAEVKV